MACSLCFQWTDWSPLSGTADSLLAPACQNVLKLWRALHSTVRVILGTSDISCQVNREKCTMAHVVQCFAIAGVRSGTGSIICTVCYQQRKTLACKEMLPAWNGKDWFSLSSVSFLCGSVLPDSVLIQHQLLPTLHICGAISPAWSATWMVGLPVCFTASPAQCTCLDIPVLTTAKRDTYIRMLLFLVPAWMTAGFPQTSIASSEVDIWWSCCQVYSYPHSRNNPLFISLLVFLAFALFRKAHVGVPFQWSIIMILPQHSAFALLFRIIWWHISLFKTM